MYKKADTVWLKQEMFDQLRAKKLDNEAPKHIFTKPDIYGINWQPS